MNKLKKGSIRNGSTVLKMALIGALLLVFLIPLHMIRALIEERNMTRLEAERQIVGMWGGEQVVAGPVVVVPYLKRVEEEGRIEEYVEKAYFLPRSLEIGGTVNTEKRRRGIYEVTVYTADLQVSGNFSAPDLSAWRVAGRDVLWQEAAVLLELPDMRGLQQEVSLQWDGRRIPFSAGQGEIGLYGGEIRAALERGTLQGGSEHRFSFALHLHGGRSLRFLPLGEQTRVRLASAWESPSFTGAFLPAERSVGAGGFEADWYILSLNRAYPQRWLRSQVQSDALLDSAFGVELMIPVDSYLKSLRSVKYGILFVLLPFLVFFLFEAACLLRVHPFQYLLVGLAVCLFYLLLVSVSEHISFDWTYLMAAAATTALITIYSAAVLAARRRAWIVSLVMASGYLFLYAALKSEDYALLIGSLGLFVILAGVMFLTRRIDWYSLGSRSQAGRKEEGSGEGPEAGSR